MKGYIYRYRNKINGKVYIGQTKDIDRRKKEHLLDCDKGRGFIFHDALRKYGIHNFEFDILHVVTGQDLYVKLKIDELEIKEIQCHRSLVPDGYNIASGGQGGDNGEAVKKWAASKEGREKIEERAKRMKASAPCLNKICAECGVDYLAKSHKSQFCSAHCRNMNYNKKLNPNKYKIDRVCQYCGRKFSASKYDASYGKALFCSYSCSRKSRG